jgi:hypothetical protein
MGGLVAAGVWLGLSLLAVLVGPAIEDSANGKSVLQASVVRTSLFVAVALYAWATVWALELWRESRSRSSALRVESVKNRA